MRGKLANLEAVLAEQVKTFDQINIEKQLKEVNAEVSGKLPELEGNALSLHINVRSLSFFKFYLPFFLIHLTVVIKIFPFICI